MPPLIRSRLATYLLAWLPLAVMIGASTMVIRDNITSAVATGVLAIGTATLLFISSFYFCKATPLHGTPTPQNIVNWVTAAFVMGSLWTLTFWGLIRLLSLYHPVFACLRVPLSWYFYSKYLVVGAIGYMLSIALNYLLISLSNQQAVEEQSRELRLLAQEAELKALRAQLNPHFLFNSLNSINALITNDPKKARHMCVLLSEFLRKSLKLGESPFVTLAEEIGLIQQYLTIEQTRFGERLQIVVEVAPGTEATPIPTLLLQPLVENAVKHGIGQVLQGGVLKITTLKNSDFVEVRVENPMDDTRTPPIGLGLGQRQVQQRLKKQYDNRYYFETHCAAGNYEVVLGFPMALSHSKEQDA